MSMDEYNRDRAEELEESFSYDGYQIVRREMFAHLYEPAVVIRRESITFNTACIKGLEDTVYIHIMIDRQNHRMAIKRCDPDDKDAIRWCIAKPDKRKSRKISSKEFSKRIYDLMRWSDKCRYKILGYKINYRGETLYVFELDESEIFYERKRKTKAEAIHNNNETELSPEQTEERKKEERKMSMKPFYPDDWDNSFGVPVGEHRNVSLDSMDEFNNVSSISGRQGEEHGTSESSDQTG